MGRFLGNWISILDSDTLDSFGFLDSWGFASNTNVAGRGTHNVKDPDEAGYGGVPQT